MTQRGKILLVDDDPGLLRLICFRLRSEGYEVEGVTSAAAALGSITSFAPDLVITDLRMDKMDGIELLSELHDRWPALQVLLITAHGTIPDAVAATQKGAFGFLTKPIDKQELLDHVERALKQSKPAVPRSEFGAGIVTQNKSMIEQVSRARIAASADSRVLIVGDSGTGKTLFAKTIHNHSRRSDRPFEVAHASAMAENLLETALFGQHGESDGAFVRAEGGTLLLAEIGDMPMRLQVKLLRVLQENKVWPVGSDTPVPVNVRLISTSSQDLNDAIMNGRFREDLLYRLNEVQVSLPPLKERREDIPLVAAHLLRECAREDASAQKVLAPDAVEVLVASRWPGNVRQLDNALREAVKLSSTPVISSQTVRQVVGEHLDKLPTFAEARDEFTRNYLSQLLQLTSGNVSQAARLAKRNRTDFYKLLARHRLEPDSFKRRSRETVAE